MSVHIANTVSQNGEQFIPASQRPDGTWRKARRVKDGYVPQEEIPLYESKGKQFNSKKANSVILASGKITERSIPGLYILQTNTKKKQMKKTNIVEVTNQLQELDITVKSKQINSLEKVKEDGKNNKTELIDPIKKLKSLRKKLREVDALQEKIERGLISKPEQEQLAKIKRKNEILMQIHMLEKQCQ
uniref:Partner of Y14 and mago n=1 Tax=Anoplophora glabripennis TaxID=217634 RepID=V5GKS4_ANOGL